MFLEGFWRVPRSPTKTYIFQCSARKNRPGRLSVKIGCPTGLPPITTTPTASPLSLRTGDPDIPVLVASISSLTPTTTAKAVRIHRRSSESTQPDPLRAFRIRSAGGAWVNSSYASASSGKFWLSGEPSTATSATGSTKRHSAAMEPLHSSSFPNRFL